MTERRRILTLLSEGRITPEEADTLLAALDGSDGTFTRESPRVATSAEGSSPTDSGAVPRFLCIQVNPGAGSSRDTVDMRVPLGLVTAGLKFSTFLPERARTKLDSQLDRAGLSFADLQSMKPEDLSDLLRSLNIDVHDDKGDHVRIFCT